MDDSNQKLVDGNTKVVADTSAELAHITQEIYKKNFELAERNKTLSLLRKIDEIILSSVTDVKQIAQQVLDVVAIDAEFKAVALYLPNPVMNVLRRVAVSRTELIESFLVQFQHLLYVEEVKISEDNNIIASCFREKKVQVTHDISSLLFPHGGEKEIDKFGAKDQIVCSLVYPFIVRGEAMGVIVISIGEDEVALSPTQLALIERLVGVIGIAIDNALLYQNIQAANERLKQLDKLKDDFVSVASHELRTPMTAIKSYLWMALDGQGGPLNDKQKYYVERGYASVERLIKLVNDMLNISRIESGRLTVEMSSIDIAKLVKEVVEEVGPRAKELGLSIEVEVGDGVPLVMADGDKIKEVIYNLIGNSMKFSQRGGKIIVSIIKWGKAVKLAVKDTGAGIALEDLPKLFQKFGILPGSYVTNQPTLGTGLGLYICRSLIELHGGRIWAVSEGHGKGATFIFTLKEFNQEELQEVNRKYNQSDVKVELISSKIL